MARHDFGVFFSIIKFLKHDEIEKKVLVSTERDISESHGNFQHSTSRDKSILFG